MMLSRASRAARRHTSAREVFAFGLARQQSSRLFSSLPQWPARGINTILNVVPQGSVHVVERFGKFQRVCEPGFYFAIPIVDRIAYKIDLREITIPIHPSVCVTKDNVSVTLDGVIFVQSIDAKATAYGASQPFLAVAQHAQSVMRSAIGTRSLDEAFHDRVRLNADIQSGIADSALNWGLVVKRYEVLTIQPDHTVAKAMDLQAVAERRRREKVTTAEADKRASVLQAQGQAEATERQAEAEKRAAVMRAEAAAQAVTLAAAAERTRVVQEAKAEAEALSAVGSQLGTGTGVQAAGMELAKAYMAMMGKGMASSNTIMMAGMGAPGQGSQGAAGTGSLLGGADEAFAKAVALASATSRAIGQAGAPSPRAEAVQPGQEQVQAQAQASQESVRAWRARAVPEAAAAAAAASDDTMDEFDAVLREAAASLDREVAGVEADMRR